jgi:hypothetical protein
MEAPNPVVSIDLVSGDVNDDNILQVTETWTYTASYAITQADIDAGFVDNTATVDGLAPNGDTVTDASDAVSTLLVQCAEIEIVKTGVYNGGTCTAPGDTIDYTFVVTNPGNVRALTRSVFVVAH